MSADPTEKTYVHVNAYSVDRIYGGPEEGGWWYDSGEPLGSIMIEDTDENRTAAKNLLRERFSSQFEGNRDRHSVIGEENLEIYVEDHHAKPYPETRPHYE